MRIDGQDVTNATPRKITESGVAHIPEDRQEDGLVLSFPVHDNFVINTYYREPFSKGMVVNEKAIHGPGRWADQGVRHPHPQRQYRSPTSQAATSRRSSWRASSTVPSGS